MIKKILTEKQGDVRLEAEKQIKNLSKNYYIEDRILDPSVFIEITDNWINLQIRYISETNNRRITKSSISEAILKEIQKNKKIDIASETVKILK